MPLTASSSSSPDTGSSSCAILVLAKDTQAPPKRGQTQSVRARKEEGEKQVASCKRGRRKGELKNYSNCKRLRIITLLALFALMKVMLLAVILLLALLLLLVQLKKRHAYLDSDGNGMRDKSKKRPSDSTQVQRARARARERERAD